MSYREEEQSIIVAVDSHFRSLEKEEELKNQLRKTISSTPIWKNIFSNWIQKHNNE